MQETSTKIKFKTYYELTKPKIWYLLVFTAFGAAITASNVYDVEISIGTWILMIAGVAAGSAAANTLTNYHDRDIDAIMDRTKERPIPSKRIFPAEKARDFGLVLAGISIACAFGISYTTSFWNGIWCGVFMLFGLADNILVYSHALKRKSQLNIILGGFSGGAPAMIGFAAVTLTGLWDFGLIIAGLVFIWIPMHIWALTLHFRDDYRKVDVPMLTAVLSEKTSARVIAGTTLMMVLFSVVPFFLVNPDTGEPVMGEVYLYTAIASGVLMILLSAWVVAKPTEKSSWVLFKFSSPYLAVLFIALMVDSGL
ncbi:MAG: heme o synthase [Thermoproteota archaeon]|jgi:protoheme IX farnesyltransferase|nr:heme o synthase [Thermoproteota archaeon]